MKFSFDHKLNRINFPTEELASMSAFDASTMANEAAEWLWYARDYASTKKLDAPQVPANPFVDGTREHSYFARTFARNCERLGLSI